MYEVLDKDTMKSEISPHLSVIKQSYVSQSGLVEVIQYILYKLKTGCQWLSYFCVSMMQSPLAVSSMPCNRSHWHHKRTCFPCRYPYACIRQNCFCIVFSKKFNIMSALPGHQSSTLPQKNDSREGWFWFKKGLVCECAKMNFYLKRPSFAPVIGLFAAKWSAFWC